MVGGFADRTPAPLASPRHLGRFFLITLGIAAAMLFQSRGAGAPAGLATSRLPLYVSLIAVELGLAWFVSVGVRGYGRSLRDVVGRPWRNTFDVFADVVISVATVAVLRGVMPLLYHVLGRWPSTTRFLLPKNAFESTVWIAVSITAGVCEELVYRGYLQRQLWSLTSSLPAALLLQALTFGITHIYQGWRPALVTAIYGLVFGLVAAWRQSIIPGAIAHASVDILAGLRL